jgi:hypothetical protein
MSIHEAEHDLLYLLSNFLFFVGSVHSSSPPLHPGCAFRQFWQIPAELGKKAPAGTELGTIS